LIIFQANIYSKTFYTKQRFNWPEICGLIIELALVLLFISGLFEPKSWVDLGELRIEAN
jgi:hypothetical protein